MDEYISLRIIDFNSIHTWFIKLNNDKKYFTSNLINWLDQEYCKYNKSCKNIYIYLQMRFENNNYVYPLDSKKTKKDLENDILINNILLNNKIHLNNSLNNIHLIHLKKNKRANAMITININDYEELINIFKSIFSKFLN